MQELHLNFARKRTDSFWNGRNQTFDEQIEERELRLNGT